MHLDLNKDVPVLTADKAVPEFYDLAGRVVFPFGQVQELLDILTWAASFEGFALRPTMASYS